MTELHGEMAGAREQARSFRESGIKANVELADLIDVLASENKNALKVRTWLIGRRYNSNISHEVLLMASHMKLSGRMDKWERATKEEREKHSGKVSKAAHIIANAVREEVRPYYPKTISVNGVEMSFYEFMKSLEKYAKEQVGAERRLRKYENGTRDRRIFVRELSNYYGRSIPHDVLGACIAIMFKEEAPASDEVARFLGLR